MTPGWLRTPDGVAASYAAAFAAAVPEVRTERLILRAPKIADFPAYREVFVSDRALFMGGPFTEEDAFSDFCQGVAGWMLRGAGMWTITRSIGDAPLGWVYLWQEMGDPEPELGWVLIEGAEGRGYASEAARAVFPHALALFGTGGFVSYIDAGNERSARLALTLGARRDPEAEARMAEAGEIDLHVYRHFSTGATQ